MSTEKLPHWLDVKAIDTALSCTRIPDKAELRDILDKSLSLTPLTVDETTALML